MTKISWELARQQALDSLRALVRLDTSNPPGNERIAADYLASELAKHGVHSVVREARPGRGNLVARIKGRETAKPPLLLSSHTDVVPVEPSGWTKAPFGAEIDQGCVWGRGALDMKSKCAMDLLLMTAIARTGALPDRDLICAAVADEEAGSEYGAKFLVERHPDLIRAGYVLNEVGGFTCHVGDRRFYPVQVAEKGFAFVKATVNDAPSHGSVPRQTTAITKLAELIMKVVNTPMRRKVTPLMVRSLAAVGIPAEFAPPIMHPMLANTAAPTMVSAGYKENVIPGEASVVLDGRLLPGENPETFCAELRSIIGPEPTLELLKTAPPVEFGIDTPLYELIAKHTSAADPGADVLPWMIPGATDNKYYARLGAVCYGFTPVKLGPTTPFGSLYHSHDERMPIDGYFWGLELYAKVVLEFLGLRFEDIFA
jgi:acetylornithine deacetylase/succinyl-diaminopimelate desuccinylase-like protein